MFTALALGAAPVKFDIPAQSAATALPLFIQQANVQVMFVHDELKDVQANAVTGEHEPFAALSLLVQGTGFTATKRNGGWFAVVRTPAEKPGSIEGTVTEDKRGRPVAGARVMLAGTTQSVLTDKRGRFTLDGVPPGDHALMVLAEGMQDTKVTDVSVKAGHRLSLSAIAIPVRQEGPLKLDPYVVSAKKNDGVVELDPFSVEGRREKPFTTANVDIPRTINDAQPYYIFESSTIESSGAVNIDDFLKQFLTMNTVAVSGSQTANGRGTSSINLRGLGQDRTLILVNGRRISGVNFASDNDSQPDISGIPASMIERIEVLPSSASGIYGGSAIGGVINVILKKDFVGGDIQLGYTNTWESDTPRKNAALNFGLQLEGGRTHINLAAAWSETSPLLLQDRRGLFEANRAVLLANNPSFLFSATSAALGALPNIIPSSPFVSTLVLKNGISLSSRNTFVPAGTSASTPAATLAAGLLMNAGNWNLELPLSTNDPSGLFRRFGAAPTTRSFRAGLNRKMTEAIQLYSDFTWSENRSESIFNPFTGPVTVSAAAPSNPFTTSVSVRFPDAHALTASVKSVNQLFDVGVIAKLPAEWTAMADYAYSKNDYDQRYYTRDGTGMFVDILSGALNPFVDTLLNPIAAEKYLAPTRFQSRTQLHTLALRGSGPLPRLPWGAPSLTIGLEYRKSHAPERTVRQDFAVSTSMSVDTTYFARETNSHSAYLEAKVPLAKGNVVPFLHSLELQASGRIDSFSVDTGTSGRMVYFEFDPPETFYFPETVAPVFGKETYQSSNYTVGLKYEPVRDVTIRGSFATAFLPPSPAELITDPAPSSFPSFVNDPVTGQSFVPVTTLGGGNPNLKPEHSESMNLGTIWSPTSVALRGLRVNVEYYKIKQTDTVFFPSAQTLVNDEASFPGRVSRDGAGNLSLVDTSAMNLYRRETDGLDFSIDYETTLKTGRVRLRLTESILLSLKTQYSATLPLVNAAGYHPEETGAAKRKMNGGVSWDRAGWSAGWNFRYFGSYRTYGVAGGPESVRFFDGMESSTATVAAQGRQSVSSQVYHDFYVGYSFRPNKDGRWLGGFKGLSVQLGVRNAFDKVPPLDAFYGNLFYISPYGDAQLRTWWINLKTQF